MKVPWIKNSDELIKRKMMEFLGIESIEELFRDVPESVRLRGVLRVGLRDDGRGVSEYELIRLAKRVREGIRFPRIPPFAGIEHCYHVVPSLVKELISRGEFYTAYTPYAFEINQGVLQALFEYQSLLAELYGVEVINASMYDGSTALAEAARMALRITRRSKILVSKGLSPLKKRVLETWLYGVRAKLEYVDLDVNGTTDVDEIRKRIDRDTAALIVETPNVYGVVETRIEEFSQLCHEKGALLIVFANPLLLGLVKPPGELGADIVVGEGQPLGLGMFYGGSTLGILGTRSDLKFVRQLPGRLVGMTLTEDGREVAYALVMQTREQHIRRERATSNITTNSALMAIAAAVYLSVLGADGLRRLSLSIASRTMYLKDRLSELKGITVLYRKSFNFMKASVKVEKMSVQALIRRVRERGILCGSDLSRYGYGEGIMTICVTEAHSRRDIDELVEILREVVEGVEAS